MSLRPCPFCGKPPRSAWNAVHGIYRIWCGAAQCPARPELDMHLADAEAAKAEATRRWNTRAEPTP